MKPRMKNDEPSSRSKHTRECVCGRGLACVGMTQAFRLLGDPRCLYVELPRYKQDPPAYKYVFRNNLRAAYLRHLAKQNKALDPTKFDSPQRRYVALHHFHPTVVKAFHDNPLTAAQHHKVPVSITEHEMRELQIECDDQDKILSMTGKPTGGYFFVPNYPNASAHDDLKRLIRLERKAQAFSERLKTVPADSGAARTTSPALETKSASSVPTDIQISKSRRPTSSHRNKPTSSHRTNEKPVHAEQPKSLKHIVTPEAAASAPLSSRGKQEEVAEQEGDIYVPKKSAIEKEFDLDEIISNPTTSRNFDDLWNEDTSDNANVKPSESNISEISDDNVKPSESNISEISEEQYGEQDIHNQQQSPENETTTSEPLEEMQQQQHTIMITTDSTVDNPKGPQNESIADEHILDTRKDEASQEVGQPDSMPLSSQRPISDDNEERYQEKSEPQVSSQEEALEEHQSEYRKDASVVPSSDIKSQSEQLQQSTTVQDDDDRMEHAQAELSAKVDVNPLERAIPDKVHDETSSREPHHETVVVPSHAPLEQTTISPSAMDYDPAEHDEAIQPPAKVKSELQNETSMYIENLPEHMSINTKEAVAVPSKDFRRRVSNTVVDNDEISIGQIESEDQKDASGMDAEARDDSIIIVNQTAADDAENMQLEDAEDAEDAILAELENKPTKSVQTTPSGMEVIDEAGGSTTSPNFADSKDSDFVAAGFAKPIPCNHQHPGSDPTLRIQVHNDLIAWESKRRSNFSTQSELLRERWRGSREIIEEGVEEIEVAERLVLGFAKAGVLFAEAMKATCEDKFLDDQGNQVTNSFMQNRLFNQRRNQEYSIEATQKGLDDSVAQSMLLNSVVEAQLVLAKEFIDNSEHIQEHILPEFIEIAREIQEEAKELEAVGDSIVAELKRSEVEVKKIWDVFDAMVTGDLMEYSMHGSMHGSVNGSGHGGSMHSFGSVHGFLSPRGEGETPIASSMHSPLVKSTFKQLGGVEDGWLIEMYYRAAVTYQRSVVDVGENELRNLSKKIVKLEDKRQRRLHQVMLSFVPRQRRLFLALPPHLSGVLDSLVGLRIDEDSLQSIIDDSIRDRSRDRLKRSSQHKSSIMNRSRAHNASLESEVDDIESEFGHPFDSRMAQWSKIVELKPAGLGSFVNAPWKLALAVLTTQGNFHLFELPETKSGTGMTVEEAFKSLCPAMDFENPNTWLIGRKDEIRRGLTPYLTLDMTRCKLVISTMRRRQLEVVEEGAKVGPSRLFNAKVQRPRRCTLRLPSESDTVEWVSLLEKTKAELEESSNNSSDDQKGPNIFKV